MFDGELISKVGQVLIIHSPSILDVSNVNVLDGLESEISTSQPETVQLDLSATTFMDSSGVGVLVRLFRFCNSQSIDFCLKTPTGQPMALLTTLKVTDVMRFV